MRTDRTILQSIVFEFKDGERNKQNENRYFKTGEHQCGSGGE